jgi:hypothetical protein
MKVGETINAFWDFSRGVLLHAFLFDGVYAACVECGATWKIGEGVPEVPESNQYLENPTLAGEYRPQDGIGELKLAPGWRCDWDHNKRRPEWRKSAIDFEFSQQWFSSNDVMDGWIWQRARVGTSNVGKIARLTVTCALKSDPNSQGAIGEYWASIGIDRWGNVGVNEKTCVWSSPKIQQSVPKWTTIELLAPIENEYVTVYIQASNKWKVDGSCFVKSAHLYVQDDPCGEVPPPVDPPPVTGECRFDDTAIVDKLDQVIALLQNGSGSPDTDAILNALALHDLRLAGLTLKVT